MNRFVGKTALITGAASGMGRAVAARMAAEGADVFAADVNEAGLAETAAQIADAGGSIRTHRCDVTSVEECGAVAAACVDAFGGIDVLGNVAGISWQDRIEDVTEDGWDMMFAVNVKGTFFMTQAALPHLIASGGSVVNFASNAGIMGMAYLSHYCATKGAIVQLTRALAMELAKTGVRVNAIAPGGVDTPMTQNYQLAADPDWDLVRPGISFRGMAEPEHLAALFAFVASDECPAIHGAIISADLGLTTG